MKHIACVQGDATWIESRLGIPTASECSRIITPKKWELAAGRRAYQIELLTERIIDGPLDGAMTPAMIHGTDSEKKARTAYEMLAGVDVEDVGFCTTDDGMVGASPDAFVGVDGGLELKCPFRPEIHVGYLLNPNSLRDEYWCQTQMQLWVTGRQWTDLVSYFVGIPMARVRITPHPEFQQKLGAALKTFLCELSDLTDIARQRGVKFPSEHKADAKPIPSRDWITDQDVEDIISMQRKKREETING